MLNRKAKWVASILYLFTGCFLAAGCSTTSPVIRVPWSQSEIRADGMDHEWPQLPPQYYDEENRISVRVMNNADSVFVCVSAGGESLKQTILMNGLILTLDPEEKDIPPFKIGFKCRYPSTLPGAGDGHTKKDPSEFPGLDRFGKKQEKIKTMTRVNLPDFVNITYPYSSGPMAMSLGEAREKGIEIGLGHPDNSRMVFEAIIRFEAISSFEEIGPGTRLTVGIESKEGAIHRKSSSRGLPGSSGGGKGSGRRGGSGDKKSQAKKAMATFEASVDVLLTTRSL